MTQAKSDLILRCRITSSLTQALSPQLHSCRAKLMASVPRAPGKYGPLVRLDPCILSWPEGHITIHIPAEHNHGITAATDLHPDFLEAVQAAFLALLQSCAD